MDECSKMDLKPETLDEIDRVAPRYPTLRSALLPVLHAVQRDQGYLSDEAVQWVAERLELQPVNVYEVVTFYPFFRRKPIGRRYLRLCRTLSCALCGSYRLAEVLEEEFGCRIGETSPDGAVTIEFAECLASCGTGPALLLDEDLYENLTEEKVRELARKIKMEDRRDNPDPGQKETG